MASLPGALTEAMPSPPVSVAENAVTGSLSSSTPPSDSFTSA